MIIKIENNDVNKRLDTYLVSVLNKSRSNIEKHIKEGDILVNDEIKKSGYLLREGDSISVKEFKEITTVIKEDIPINIVYEDEYLMVVNKPSGLVVHPGSGNKSGTLVNGLVNYTGKLSNLNGDFRPGIVHRIDKDTSGLLLISKTNKVHELLTMNFKDNVKRKYIALVEGIIKEEKGKIDAPIGRDERDRKKMCVTPKNSKEAVTNFEVIERYKNSTLVRCILETGRTHQIRVHFAYINHPVINDPVYNKKHVINDYGQLLHAYYLGFTHPVTKEFLEFNVPPEEEFTKLLETFKNS